MKIEIMFPRPYGERARERGKASQLIIVGGTDHPLPNPLVGGGD